MDDSCELAPRGEVKAFYVTGGSGTGDLWVVATGETSTPCWDVEIERSPLEIWPPQFAIVACRAGGMCPQVVTPYSAIGRFAIGGKPDSIQVSDAGGARDMSVEDAPDTTAAATSDGSVVGYSRAPVRLEEAIDRAASQLPRPHPNAGVTITVDEIWYSDGGIVGPVLYVRGKAKR